MRYILNTNLVTDMFKFYDALMPAVNKNIFLEIATKRKDSKGMGKW
jgi:hypothetical protein